MVKQVETKNFENIFKKYTLYYAIILQMAFGYLQ